MAERDVDRPRTDIHVEARSSGAGAWIVGALVLLLVVGLVVWFLPVRDGGAPAVTIDRSAPTIVAPAPSGGGTGGAAAGASAGGGAAGAVSGATER